MSQAIALQNARTLLRSGSVDVVAPPGRWQDKLRQLLTEPVKSRLVNYSLWLKHVAIIDIAIISLGFVLRLFVGSIIAGIPLSSWIVIMTFLLALFIALAKRRDDMVLYLDTGKKARPVIDGYNLQMIDGAMAIMASVVIVAYLLYTTSAAVTERLQSDYVYLTTLFVIIGIMRYLQLTLVFKQTGSPTRLVIRDNFLRATVLAWLLGFAWIIYQ